MTFEELGKDFTEKLSGRIASHDLRYLLSIADKNRTTIENAIKTNSSFPDWLLFVNNVRDEMLDRWETSTGPADHHEYEIIDILWKYMKKRYYMEFL